MVYGGPHDDKKEFVVAEDGGEGVMVVVVVSEQALSHAQVLGVTQDASSAQSGEPNQGAAGERRTAPRRVVEKSNNDRATSRAQHRPRRPRPRPRDALDTLLTAGSDEQATIARIY